jgi:hypothetical protein
MSTWKKFRIYCITEAGWSEGILETGEPSTCFNNAAHEVNPNSVQEIQSISETVVTVKEESTNTGGYFSCTSYKMACPVGESLHTYSFPVPVSALSITITTTIDNQDDVIYNTVAPLSTIGIVTVNTAVSDTVINVSLTAIQNLKLGFFVTLTDGTNTNNCGRVVSIDKANNRITVETPVANIFSSSSPTYIKRCIRTINNYTIGPPARYVIGADKIGGSYVPANVPIQLKYINNGNETVNFYSMIEYLY